MGESRQDIFINYVREHHAGLRAFIRSVGVDPMWVDDIAQEAFIVAYNRMEEFDTTRDFGAWVRGIARNLVINERRKDARRKRILSENLTDVLVSTTSVPEEEEEQLGDRATAKLIALRQCIADLPEKSMRLIRGRYEEDVSAPDLAEELDMKPPAVRKALERVRTALRKCMEEKLRPAGA
ncbi:MAG: sigma-70 family RNA polymerase sigma factor [Verrucomicrobiales bacterium]|nr:sigma-70 family RNA polymerase sigma factor [Verrucomicrobiales bacterium]